MHLKRTENSICVFPIVFCLHFISFQPWLHSFHLFMGNFDYFWSHSDFSFHVFHVNVNFPALPDSRFQSCSPPQAQPIKFQIQSTASRRPLDDVIIFSVLWLVGSELRKWQSWRWRQERSVFRHNWKSSFSRGTFWKTGQYEDNAFTWLACFNSDLFSLSTAATTIASFDHTQLS